MIDISKVETRDYKGFTFALERFADVVEELAPMHRMQWAEVDERMKVFEFRPNYPAYAQMEQEGRILQFVIRKSGALVGYCMVMLFESLHTQLLSAQEDSLFLHPDYRGGFMMVAFVKYIIHVLTGYGVRDMRVTSKTSNKAYVLMERAGFVQCAKQLVFIPEVRHAN